MSDWLTALRHALDARDTELRVFFRNDDAGWADGRLFQLLDVFDTHACSVDLAVIPVAASEPLASALIARRRAGARIGFHQHGFSHDNHEPAGRPCEFGPSRSASLQTRDIADGQQRLNALFGRYLDPIFTPPWNRCSVHTGRAVLAAGLHAISCDSTAPPLAMANLVECPVHVDWFAKSKGQRLDRPAWAAQLARRVADSTEPLGIMLHHAQMDNAEREGCDQLIGVIARHPGARVVPMKEVVVKS